MNLPNVAQLPIDLRAEVLARMLVLQGDLETHQIQFRPSTFYQRQGRADVLDVTESYSHTNEQTVLNIDISRESWYDCLPEALFLHPNEHYGDDLSRMRALGAQEAAARQFLLPFEQLFYWLRLDNEVREYSIETQLPAWWQRLTADNTTPTIDLSPRQRAILNSLQPHLPSVIGNWELTAQWLSLLLESAVEIVEKAPPQYPLPAELQKRLGEGLLGEDFVIGTTFCDGFTALDIRIQNLSAESVVDFLPEGSHRKILEDQFLSLLLPVEVPYEVVLDVEKPTVACSLGSRATDVVGFNFYLSS